VTLTGRLSEALLGHWIMTAWNDFCQESVLKGLKKCYVSCGMSRADALWKIMEQEFSSSDENVGFDCLSWWCVCNVLLQLARSLFQWF
jgi:hypothetical protein